MGAGSELGITGSVPNGAAGTENDIPASTEIDFGDEYIRGFLFDNVLHSEGNVDIHFGLYIPESYDGSEPYALYVTLPGYEGLYFQGVDVNIRAEDQKVYLNGYSCGGETGFLVMEIAPELYTAFLHCSSQWDGDLDPLAKAGTPIYMVTGENDSYYGSSSVRETYEKLVSLYKEMGFTEEQINRLVVLDLKDQSYFDERGIRDQHGGGGFFAHEADFMGWLFGEH